MVVKDSSQCMTARNFELTLKHKVNGFPAASGIGALTTSKDVKRWPYKGLAFLCARLYARTSIHIPFPEYKNRSNLCEVPVFNMTVRFGLSHSDGSLFKITDSINSIPFFVPIQLTSHLLGIYVLATHCKDYVHLQIPRIHLCWTDQWW